MAKRSNRTFVQRSREIPPATKASFHHVVGAGRSRVRREFFGLSKTDEDAIVAKIDAFIAHEIQKGEW